MLYEEIMQVKPEDSGLVTGTARPMKPEERELMLLLMLRNIRCELETLKVEALQNNDKLALECLHTIANESVSQLSSLAMNDLELVASVARGFTLWPVLYGTGKPTREAADEYLKAIELGTEYDGVLAPDNMLERDTVNRKWLMILCMVMNRIRNEYQHLSSFSKKFAGMTPNELTIARALVVDGASVASSEEIVQRIRTIVMEPDIEQMLQKLFEQENPFAKAGSLDNFIKACASLPELQDGKAVVKQWIQVIRGLLMDVYDGHPEQSSLRNAGMYLAEGNSALNPKGTASYESNIRSGIFAQLEKTLNSITQK